MAEVEIKRTNFFDGQFLKEGEFKDLDLYHMHMRRRWAFVMFNQSGVVQAGASDLLVEVPNAANKELRVRAGMAIGKRPDLAEAKEVILRQDSPLISLTATSAEVPTPITAGQTGFVTLHYDEQGVPNPPSEGDVPGNTRVLEHARITVHNAVPPPSAPNGEPYIRLGDVTFNSMALSTAGRQQAFFNAALLAQPAQITVSPGSVPATGTAVLTVTASGPLNLSGATNASVTISPNTGVTHAVSNPTNTSFTLTLTLNNATVGLHNLTVTTNATASTTFSVAVVVPAPTLTAVPAAATKNQLMTIGGTNFLSPVTVAFTGGAVVGPNFNGVGESLSPTQIVLRVPGANANTGTITVSAAGGSIVSANPVVII